MAKLNILWLAMLICLISTFAWADEMTLTTYYPAPYGVYREFKTTNNTYLATDGGRVGIGTTNPQGILDVTSTTSGFLPPRMTTSERDNITSPQAGMVIYNTNTDSLALEIYTGTAWVKVGASGGISNIVAFYPGEPVRDGPPIKPVRATCPTGKTIFYAAGFVNDIGKPCNETADGNSHHCSELTWLTNCIGQTSCTYTGKRGDCFYPGYACLQILCQ